MKISILSPNLSKNGLGRAYLLAKILSKHYDVEIVGPLFGDNIWEPADDNSIRFRKTKMSGNTAKDSFKLRELLNNTDADIFYASKPFFTSFGLGIMSKFSKKKPLILDVDDYEMGFIKSQEMSPVQKLKFLTFSALKPYHPGTYWNTSLSEKLSFIADEITVSNTFLQRKFGGTIIWHARDTDFLNPTNFDPAVIKKHFNIPINKKIVMFLGTPGPHKGLEDVIDALTLIEEKNFIFILVGLSDSVYSKKLTKIAENSLKGNFLGFGFQKFRDLPEFLAMADLMIVPQKKSLATVGQIPAKIFDAMSMAKPTISTNVSDIPQILEGVGWTVEPGNVKQIANNIQYIFDNPQESKVIGLKAREKCIKEYSYHAMSKKLVKIMEKYD